MFLCEEHGRSQEYLRDVLLTYWKSQVLTMAMALATTPKPITEQMPTFTCGAIRMLWKRNKGYAARIKSEAAFHAGPGNED